MDSPTVTMMTNANNDLGPQLAQIGLKAVAQNLDDIIARATKGRWSPRVLLEELYQIENRERSRLSLEHRLRFSGIGRFKPIADFANGVNERRLMLVRLDLPTQRRHATIHAARRQCRSGHGGATLDEHRHDAALRQRAQQA